jgi:hypothetical protein
MVVIENSTTHVDNNINTSTYFKSNKRLIKLSLHTTPSIQTQTTSKNNTNNTA